MPAAVVAHVHEQPLAVELHEVAPVELREPLRPHVGDVDVANLAIGCGVDGPPVLLDPVAVASSLLAAKCLDRHGTRLRVAPLEVDVAQASVCPLDREGVPGVLRPVDGLDPDLDRPGHIPEFAEPVRLGHQGEERDQGSPPPALPGGEVPQAPLPTDGDLCEEGTFYTDHPAGAYKGESLIDELDAYLRKTYRLREPEVVAVPL